MVLHLQIKSKSLIEDEIHLLLVCQRGPEYDISNIYDRRDDINFLSVNFPFLSGNISETPAYEVYISQLIRFSRGCCFYHDFLDVNILLTRKLLNQGFLMVKLKTSLRKFKGHHFNHYGISVPHMTTDIFPLS